MEADYDMLIRHLTNLPDTKTRLTTIAAIVASIMLSDPGDPNLQLINQLLTTTIELDVFTKIMEQV